MTRTLRIATRTSPLALAQTQLVTRALATQHPHVNVEIVEIDTRADRDERPLQAVGARGMFAVELEAALRDGAVDAAVHSWKDLALEADEAQDLAVAAVLPRGDARDALVCDVTSLDALPRGARIGTSSARRTAALLRVRPDLAVEPIRGNVQTRIERMRERGLDGCLLAQAGLVRLDSRVARVVVDTTVIVPEPAQGAVVVQAPATGDFAEIWASIDDVQTRRAVLVERCIARQLGGGCDRPVGVHVSYVDDDSAVVSVFLSDQEGSSQYASIVIAARELHSRFDAARTVVDEVRRQGVAV